VFLLDTYNEVYVWVGSGSNEIEKKKAMESAIEYVKSAQDGRDENTPILRIAAGFEPKMFTAHFHAWDPSKKVNYERQLQAMNLAGGANPVSVKDALAAYDKKYPLEDLKKRPLPPAVDASKLEYYLSDDDFKKAFNMDREAFSKLQQWKKNDLKKKVGLF
jgi:hypothetical protein